ncbi:hypothetical protein EC2864350_4797 [Escherichia coli 2864350]|nr:hypothetical protein [Escherichia coli]EMV27740.1 hypothetical protein ECC34666_5469 [Escherichia coli C-34666]EMW33506.1 hypothetical protein EC2785200_3183 [Escherichia coli 2785200]EMW44188.1 hypothetical protein EC2788150_0307 [Escherichia coli 2788150]ENA03525.1 hypothetical protein ECP02999171_4185 [Escherichia coli P0299917.1]ENA89466.1 hypothetical protein EC2864350_4797 [Escherichia coli 2864350]ENC27236.1 hypothetical protein ECP029970676_5048 [Escherichia coli P02997067.6]ENC43
MLFTLLCSGVHKNKNQFIQKHPLKTIQNRHASQRIPTEKNTCSNIPVPFVQVTGNSDLNF